MLRDSLYTQLADVPGPFPAHGNAISAAEFCNEPSTSATESNHMLEVHDVRAMSALEP